MTLRLICLLFFLSMTAQADDPDCSMCHDSSPLKENHMPVSEVSVEYCTSCHEKDREDPFIQALHKHTEFGMECSNCHDDGRTSFDEAASGAASGTK